jgi:hypothetical protein
VNVFRRRPRVRPIVRGNLVRVGRRLSPAHLMRVRSILSYLEVGHWLSLVADGSEVRQAQDRFGVFSVALEHLRADRTVYLEFGVFEGETLRWWSAALGSPQARFFGFDSFEGLPERWRGLSAGAFGTDAIPVIEDERVSLIVGWFEDTLPQFELPPYDQLIVNIDSDLYTSARTILTWLESRLRPGDLISFDEFADRDHEMRALFEFLVASQIRVRPLAIGGGGEQLLLEVLETTSEDSTNRSGSQTEVPEL